MSINHDAKGELTFGAVLKQLYDLSSNHYHNQVAMYSALFASYCVHRGELENVIWQPSQGSVSRVYMGFRPSWPQYNWYLNIAPEKIRPDVEQYLQSVAATSKMQRLHTERLEALVAGASNLDERDRAYIMSYVEVGEETALEELLYRILVVLYHEPRNTARK